MPAQEGLLAGLVGVEVVDERLELHQSAVAPPRPRDLQAQPRAQRLGDAGEMQRRYGGDVGQVWGRYGGDMGEIWGRYGAWVATAHEAGETSTASA